MADLMVGQALQRFFSMGKEEWTLTAELFTSLGTVVNDISASLDSLQSQIDALVPISASTDPLLPNVSNFIASVAYWQNIDGSWFYQLSGSWDIPTGTGIKEVVVYQRQTTPPAPGVDDIVIQPLASTPTSFRSDWTMMPDQSLLVPGPYQITLFAVSGDGKGGYNPIFTTGSRTTPSSVLSLVDQAGGLLLNRSDPLSFDATDFDIVGPAFVVKNIRSAKIEVDSTLKVGGGTGLFTGPGQVGVFDTGNVMNAWMGRRIQTGICNVTGTAVHRTSGEFFLPSMALQPIALNGLMYTCASFTDANNIVLSAPAANGTGVAFAARTSTYGGWFAKLYVGGTAPENSPFYVNNSGVLTIENAYISLISGSNSLILDPTTATLTVSDSFQNVQISAGTISYKDLTVGSLASRLDSYLGAEMKDVNGHTRMLLDANIARIVLSNDAYDPYIRFEDFNGPGSFRFHRSNGTIASPTNVLANEWVGYLTFQGQGLADVSLYAAVNSTGTALEIHAPALYSDFHGGAFYAGADMGTGGSVNADDVTIGSTNVTITGIGQVIAIPTISKTTAVLTFNSGLITHIA